MNNGTCFNSYGGYYCRCPKGWIGDNCLQGNNISFEVSGVKLGNFDDDLTLIFEFYIQ